MPKVKAGFKRRNGRKTGAPEGKNTFRAAYKKSLKMMQDALGAETGEVKYPGNQTTNKERVQPPPPPERMAARDGTGTHGLDTSDIENIAWAPQPGPQTALLLCPVEDVFFGGARGGG